MFAEEYTYERLLESTLANAPAGIDTRPGSIYYDAISGVLFRIAQLYADLDMVGDLISIDTATGKYLEEKAAEKGIYRLPATNACYYVTFEGAQPEVGERFYNDGRYFALRKDTDGTYYLEAEEAGTGANGIYSGAPAIPVNNIPGLTVATFGEVLEAGAEQESDDDLRERLREKLAGPAENGNKQHYRTWCEEVEGVGRARIIPLWNGPNTVKGVIIDPNGLPAGDAVVARVQKYVDPDDDGDGEGDGLGEGVANLGAHFTAVAPESRTINVSFNAVLTVGSTQEKATAEATAAITAYFKKLTLDTPDGETIVARISAVGAIISGLPSVLDYNSLMFNGESANIQPGNDAVAVLGEVTVNVLQ